MNRNKSTSLSGFIFAKLSVCGFYLYEDVNVLRVIQKKQMELPLNVSYCNMYLCKSGRERGSSDIMSNE